MKITIDTFSGMAPRLADYQLAQEQASFAANLKVSSGALRGFRSNILATSFAPTATIYARVARLFYPGVNTYVWWKNQDVNATVLQSPLTNDAFNRVYYADKFHTKIQITTLEDIAANAPSRDLGITPPAAAPTVTATGGTGATDVRAYVYVWVSDYGEVSAPSPPTLVTGKIDSTWTITPVSTPPAYVQWVDTYRTATGKQSSGNYYRVKRQAAPGAAFTDTMAPDLVPLQPPLSSIDNYPPPANLQGLVKHSSGAIAGFVGRDVYFSVPYLPHAWPPLTKYTMPTEVVGLAATGNTVVALCKGFPTVIVGTRPDGMALQNLTASEPCLSTRSIVVHNNTVFYASPNGIASVGPDGLNRPTNALLIKEDWEKLNPGTFIAATSGSHYIAFYDASNGIAVALPPYEPTSLVRLDRYDEVTGVDTDLRSGEMYTVTGDRVWRFDALSSARFATTWRSKQFILAAPTNMGAFQIVFDQSTLTETIAKLVAEMTAYNLATFATLRPLNVLNGSVLNKTQPFTIPPNITVPPPMAPLGGQALYDIEAILASIGVRFTVIADGQIIHSELVTDETVHKLPSGYKYTKLYLELSAAVDVQRVIVAETARELRAA